MTVSRILTALDRLLMTVLAVLMTVALFTMFAQAVDRYCIGSGFSAYDQVAKIAMIWTGLIGLPVVFHRRRNISADLIGDMFPARLRLLRGIIFDAIVTMLAALVLWYGIPVMRVGAFQQIIGVPLTYWAIYLSLNLSMGLTMVFVLPRLVLDLRKAFRFRAP